MHDDDEQDPQSKELFCYSCGSMHNSPVLDDSLWDLYHRLISGVQNYEPLVFTSDWMEENIFDEEDHLSMMGAMERDMINRGLCGKCGRPDLRGKKEDDFYTEEDMKDMREMWAEQAAERRMGA